MNGGDSAVLTVATPAPRTAAPAWRLPRNRSAWIGAAVLALIILIAALAPYLGTTNPAEINPAARNKRPGAERVIRNDDGTTTVATFRMGTDSLGRDVYSRVLYGARVSLLVGVSVAALSVAIGLAIGLVSGYIPWLDAIVMRVMDGLMSVPAILLAITLVSLSKGAGLRTVIVA
ncbi:MAG TPA: ABC transporter permease, partial [Methylomirabilota bacterium]